MILFLVFAPGAGLPPHVQLAPELLALFRAPVLAANNAGSKGKRIPEPSSPEVNNSTGGARLMVMWTEMYVQLQCRMGCVFQQSHGLNGPSHHIWTAEMLFDKQTACC